MLLFLRFSVIVITSVVGSFVEGCRKVRLPRVSDERVVLIGADSSGVITR